MEECVNALREEDEEFLVPEAVVGTVCHALVAGTESDVNRRKDICFLEHEVK